MDGLVAGSILLPDRVEQGWVRCDDGRVSEIGTGTPPERPDARGWVVPAPVNAHTHIADTFLRDAPGKPRCVAALVGPGGWKHRHLARAGRHAQDGGSRRLAQEMAASGTAAFLDFREGGIDGVRWLRRQDLPVPAHILGRPAHGGFDEDEAAMLLAEADGIGLSGMQDMAAPDIEAWAQACHDARSPFAIHVSEAQRDDIDAVLALEPAFVVHMSQGTTHDLEALAHARIPIVVCPRSNAWFGMRPPLATMLEAGCTVALGTDNGMLVDGDIWREAAATARLVPDADEADVLRMATYHGRRLAGLPDPLAKGAQADIVVLRADALTPHASHPVEWTAARAEVDA